MGNVIPCGPGGGSSKNNLESQLSVLSKNGGGEGADGSLGDDDFSDQKLEHLIKDMKEYHKNRLRTEMETDPQNFILDNLLMCIQFFDNFDKAREEANQFKWDTEREMTELLSKDPLEGTILGDRRVKLLTGMSNVLAQNYIYHGTNHREEDEETDIYYGGLGFKQTFMAEGILPLDFSMTWDNLELYDQSEWHHLKEYSDAKGASPMARFCMEQPDKKTNFPKGYVRLRCVDEPISHRKKLDTPPVHPLPLPATADLNYNTIERHESVYSNPYADAVIPEANSESEECDSELTSEDDDIHNLKNILNALPSSPKPISTFTMESNQSTSSSKDHTGGRPNRPLLPKLNLTKPSGNVPPSFIVHAATPTPNEIETVNGQRRPFENIGLLHPPPQRARYQEQQLSRNSENQGNYGYSTGKENTSSGYDTTSSRSRSSSMQSEFIRDKWQKYNLKRLWEFGKKSRKESIQPNVKYDPIPANCYAQIKYESGFDESIEEEDDDDSDYDITLSSSSSSDEDDSPEAAHRRRIKQRQQEEDEYEMRFYLNSLQLSSNACSEFHYIGPKISIPPSSLGSGVVMGTTIRCPIAHPYPKDNEDEDENTVGSYDITYTFTPTLHSKTWPNGMYSHFNLHVGAFSNMNNPVGDRWPSREQLEKIETAGCNAIPLGFRPMDFFNTEQILEWELNFHDAETILLHSLRYPHWRTYIFSAILFRAFISPLGPQGIGLEHIRNVLYFMCHENFRGWEDEQPGLHLRILLDNLFKCLSRTNMPSFFIRSRNLFQSIPPQNLRFVQGHLNQIRNNLTIYCIYAFGNLMSIKRDSANSFTIPNFDRLYEMMTCSETDLLKIISPILMRMQNDEDEKKREESRQKARKHKKKKNNQSNLLLGQQDEIDREYFSSQREIMGMNYPPMRKDKTYHRLRKEHEKYVKKLEDHRRKLREQDRLNRDPERRIPNAERRKPIDLKKFPEQFSTRRLLLIVQFFVKHFMEMAEKAQKLQNPCQATMYLLQVENLCEIVSEEKYKETISPFDQEELEEYREKTLRLRAILDKDMYQYIMARVMSSPQPGGRSSRNQSLHSVEAPGSPTSKHLPRFTNNWDLRKLPTPPQSVKDDQIQTPAKKLEKPKIASSLQSFDSLPTGNNVNQMRSGTPAVAPRLSASPIPISPEDIAESTASKLPTDKDRVVRRQESLKFVSSVIPATQSTPPRPTRAMGNKVSRHMSVSLDTEVESTDL